jgi:predicted DNA-binding antitoxin AbrB/MazE fold protein
MTITIDATYEDGVLKPAQPLPLGEHEKVRVTVEQTIALAVHPADGSAIQRGKSSLSAIEKIIARAESLPDEVVASWPTDGASQHDHYLYGAPKRIDLRNKPE